MAAAGSQPPANCEKTETEEELMWSGRRRPGSGVAKRVANLHNAGEFGSIRKQHESA
jgi:hypothetical protein